MKRQCLFTRPEVSYDQFLDKHIDGLKAEMERCEKVFWSRCMLNEAGERTDKPRKKKDMSWDKRESRR